MLLDKILVYTCRVVYLFGSLRWRFAPEQALSAVRGKTRLALRGLAEASLRR